MQLQSGTLLQGGKYRIEKVLGQGGFGITYQAVQVALNRKVAIKEFFMKEYCDRDSETSHVSVPSERSKELVGKCRIKFVKEAQNIAGLSHPHIISIYDIFEENGTAYYVMEHIDNGALSDLVEERGQLSEAEALHYIRQVADALGYIHKREMNHLSIKPSNILLGKKMNAVLLFDKELCEWEPQDPDEPAPEKDYYAPIEQYKKGGVGTFSPATDIYSLGATLYKLLTGNTPPDVMDLMDDEFPPLPGHISTGTASAIMRSMQFGKKNRPQSIAEFLALLPIDNSKGQNIHSVHEGEELEETNIESVGVEREYFNVLPSGTLLHGHSYTYEIVKVLGQGTFGISYLANVRLSGALGELQSTVQVAIKEFFMKDVNGRQGYSVTSGSDSDIYRNYRNDFMREANNLARMKHPHIVRVLEAFEANNTCYFSMEYIDGGNLNEYISQCQSLSERESLQGIVEIGEALAFMHDNKMLHLDLKPLNVMRRKDGGLVLIDFGLSKQFDRNGEPESSTRIGGGTIGYAPLEQANYRKGEGFPATLDIYALGATLLKMLTGKTPADASTIFNEGFPEDELRQCGVSGEVISLVSWAMEPMRRKRPQTVKEFLDEARRLLPGSSETQKVREPSRRNFQKKQTKTVTENSGWCNGFTVNWQSGLKESQKNAIRRLLGRMRKVDEIKEYANNEYITHSVTSSCCYISSELYNQIMGVESTVGYFGPKNFTISDAMQFLLKLQQYTGLPFRFPQGVKGIIDTMPAGLEPRLDYLPEKGFVYDNHWTGGEKLVQSYEDFSRTYCLEIACDRMSPMIVGGRLDVPWTQFAYNQLEPIGFGFYKGEVDGRWRVDAFLLEQKYDYVSCIDLYTIPGPGAPQLPFLGIKAYCGDRITCYELKNGRFNLLTEMSKREWEEREMWT